MKTTDIKAGHTGLACSEFPSNGSALDQIHDILRTEGICIHMSSGSKISEFVLKHYPMPKAIHSPWNGPLGFIRNSAFFIRPNTPLIYPSAHDAEEWGPNGGPMKNIYFIHYLSSTNLDLIRSHISYEEGNKSFYWGFRWRYNALSVSGILQFVHLLLLWS